MVSTEENKERHPDTTKPNVFTTENEQKPNVFTTENEQKPNVFITENEQKPSVSVNRVVTENAEQVDNSDVIESIDNTAESDAFLDASGTHQSGDLKKTEGSTTLVKEKAPDGGWGWFIILGCLLLRMVIGGIGRSHGILYIKFKDRFNGSATSTALITSLTAFVRLAGGPFVSVLTNRFSCRGLTSIGVCFLFLGLILSAYTPNRNFLYFSYGTLCGLGRAFALTPAPILLGRYFDKRRSLAFGLASAGFSLGGFAISPVVEVLFQTFGFQGAFLVLAGFVTHIFISAALFRPIELNRRLTMRNGLSIATTKTLTEERPGNVVLGDEANSSTLKDDEHSHVETTNGMNETCTDHTKEVLITNTNDVIKKEKKHNFKCCGKRRESPETTRKKWISLSILKDVRFVCFVLATVFFTLPNTLLFLPSMAVSKGISEINAAYLLSVMAGVDTVTRVISGFILDFKLFRKIRPHIFCGVTFLQSLAEALVPLMSTLGEFMLISIVIGMLTGIRSAQGTVILLDILGVDKLASSMAITMSAQGLSVFLGTSVAGQLKDSYGTYDGAFYFASAALFFGATVMSFGQMRKYYVDKRKKVANEEATETQSS